MIIVDWLQLWVSKQYDDGGGGAVITVRAGARSHTSLHSCVRVTSHHTFPSFRCGSALLASQHQPPQTPTKHYSYICNTEKMNQKHQSLIINVDQS